MRKRWLVVGLMVVAAGAEGTALWLDRDDGGRKTATVATVAAGTGDVTVDVAATGTVKAAATRSLGFAVDGTVGAVAVRAGSVVKAGAVLARVDTGDATDAVDDARVNLADAEDQLAAAKTVTTAATTLAAAARPAAAGGLDAIFTAQERVNQAEATLAEAEAALSGATIKAPIAGTVMTVAGQVGSKVNRGATFLTLADTYAMQVSAAFPEADAGALAVGQPATVTLADRVGQEYPAAVAQVDPVGTSDGTLVTYGVVLKFADQPHDLLAGQSAAVEVHTGMVRSALRVPSTAVHDVGDGHGLVMVRSGNASTSREVSVGLRGGTFTQITAGLAAGEMVVRSW